MFSGLVTNILLELVILVVSLDQTVFGIFSELLNNLKSLGGFEFNLRVVVLHELEIVDKTVKLLVEESSQELNVLTLVIVLVKNLLKFNNFGHGAWSLCIKLGKYSALVERYIERRDVLRNSCAFGCSLLLLRNSWLTKSGGLFRLAFR